MSNRPVTSPGALAILSAVGLAASGQERQITCPQAFAVARRLSVSPAQVGAVADELGVRVSRCQLGLFGYGSKAEGRSKIVRVADPVPRALGLRLRAMAGEDGAVTCEQIWEIAAEAHVGRLAVAGAAQGLVIHISTCQLGCFKPRPAVGH